MPDEIILGNPQAPQPEAPMKPTVDETILHAYFESIKDTFKETWKSVEKDRESVSAFFILFFVLSLIPLLPFLGYKVTTHYFGDAVFTIKGFRIHCGSFWFWWVVLFLVSLGILLLAIKISGVSNTEKKKWLSPPQMRFAFSYSVVEEIQKFRMNQMERHKEAAIHSLDKTCEMLFPRRAIYSATHSDPIVGRQIVMSSEEAMAVHVEISGLPKWYKLQPETERILKAFKEVPLKIRDRLKDCKDLPVIQSALTYLAAYHYFEIPQLSDAETEMRFEQGMAMLSSFAAQIESLGPYRSEQLKKTPKEKLSIKFGAVLSRVTAPFGHENPMIAFLCWLVLLFLLFSLGFYTALRYTALQFDSTILNALIGGPILGAVTAVTIPRISKSRRE